METTESRADRAEFEAWYAKKHPKAMPAELFRRHKIHADVHHYFDTQDYWEAWQAAWQASRATLPQAGAAREAEWRPVATPARALAEWHEDDGAVLWWAWCGHDWAGEAAWSGTPLCDNWPGYHTHWTAHPKFPAPPASVEGG